MSFTYGFYDSINHDRTYNARQMSEIFDGIINDGVFESIGNKFMVSAVSGMQIKVGSGRAWFNHTWTNNDSDMPLTLDAAEPLYKRIDAIVLEVNENQDTRENSIKIIKGTPASTPSKPTLINTDGIHQHILGWITINGGATAITQANIENAIGTSATPYVTAILQVTNVDQLLAQWDAQFGEWFRNIQAQMEGDVATHLQQQITDNWNNTVSMVSDASKTVLDVSKNALIKVKTEFDTCRLVKTTGGSYISLFYDGYSGTGSRYYMYAWNGKLYMFGHDSEGHAAVLEYGNNGQFVTQWRDTDRTSGSDYITYMCLNGSAVSANGSAVATVYGNSKGRLIDLHHRTMSYINRSIYLYGCGVTENYQFYFQAGSATDRRLYYAPRGSNTSWNDYILIGNGYGSSNYAPYVLGVYGDTVWYIEQLSSTSYGLGKVMLGSTPQYVSSVQIFDGFTQASMSNIVPLYHNASYAFIGIKWNGNYIKSYVLRISLLDGSSNWSTVKNSENVEWQNTIFGYLSYNYYIGTSNNKAYFHGGSYGCLTMDCSTMALSATPWTDSVPVSNFNQKPMYGFENICSGAYNGYLIQEKHLYKLATLQDFEVKGPRYTKRDSGFVVDNYRAPVSGGNVYFAGGISSAAPVGYSGSYSSFNTEILIGPPERNIVGIVT